MKLTFRRLSAVALALALLLVPAAALELDDARALLETYYVDEISDEILSMGSLDEIFSALGDPYTSYMSQAEYAAFLDSVDGGTIQGVGVSIQSHLDEEGGLLILSILPGTPAQEAGLQAGDRILAVDGQEIASFEDTALIRGEAGSAVTLTLRRAGSGREESVTLERREVSIPIVTYDLADSVPVIRCISFGSTTSDSIQQAIEDYAELNRPYVMDLRSNPGGTSDAAIRSAGLFIGSAVMVAFRDGSGAYRSLFTMPGYADLTDQPLIVLTSPYSASASELFAAAVRDHGAGISVGQRTFGKGIAQVVLDESSLPELFDGDCLKITAYRFYSPHGATNDTVGVIPTLTVSPENAAAAALLLAEGAPDRPDGCLRLELAGQTLYLSLAKAAEQNAAFAELLESLPPAAVLSRGVDGQWTQIAPGDLAEELGLDFTPRTFSDTAGTEYAQAVDTLAVHQILGGYEDGTFRPERTVTRAEFCAMVAAALNLRQSAAPLPFSDVEEDAWYAPYVSAAYAKGLIAGSGGAFRPNDAVTYQEMVSVMAQVAQWMCIDGSRYAGQMGDESLTSRYTAFDAWAQPSALVVDFMGALDKDADPRQSGTRGAAAQLLCDLMEAAHLLWD